MKSATVELFDNLVVNVERLRRVVVEEMGRGSEVRCGACVALSGSESTTKNEEEYPA